MQEITWTDFEYPHKKRSVDWYWGLGLVTICAAGLSIFLGNLLFGIFILLAGLTVGLLAIRIPREIEYKIADQGIHLGEAHYSYAELESFFVDEQKYCNKLILLRKKIFLPQLIITLPAIDPHSVRDYLLHRLPESEHHEPFLHALGERLGI